MLAALLAAFFTDGGAPAKAAEPVTVKVGAYEYGVVYYFENGKPNGMVPLLIGLLNGLQDDYEFQLVETSSRRRYKALVDGDVDLLLLESAQWDWQDYAVQFSEKIVTEKDVYVTQSSTAKTDDPFADVTNQSILCVLGFHYGFAKFNSDPEFLKRSYDVLLRYNEKEVLNGVLAREAPIGIVSAGFLARELAATPGLGDLITVGVQPDAMYDLVSVIANQSVISVADFNQMIEKLQATGEVQRLWQELHANTSG